MIENNLTHEELSRLIRTFLRLEPITNIVSCVEEVLGIKVSKPKDIVCQHQTKVFYKSTRVDILEMQYWEGVGASIHIDFRKLKDKWWHAFSDPAYKIKMDLLEICQAEIPRVKLAASRGLRDQCVYFHDARFFNAYRIGRCEDLGEISPIFIYAGGMYFDPRGYKKVGGYTVLREDWGKNSVIKH
jgi:hypothetical protein